MKNLLGGKSKLSDIHYIVICRADRKPDGTKGDYQLATHRTWKNKTKAEKYANGISDSREPLVVESLGPLVFSEK